MKPIAFVSLLSLGLALFLGAATIQAKTGIPPRASEFTGLAMLLLGIYLIARTLVRSSIAWIRALLAAPGLVKNLEARLDQLQTEHSQSIQNLANRHAAEVEKIRKMATPAVTGYFLKRTGDLGKRLLEEAEKVRK